MRNMMSFLLAGFIALATTPSMAFSDVEVGKPVIKAGIAIEMARLLNLQAALLGGTRASGSHFTGWPPDSCIERREQMRTLDAKLSQLVARTAREQMRFADAMMLSMMFDEYYFNARALDALYDRSCRPGA